VQAGEPGDDAQRILVAEFEHARCGLAGLHGLTVADRDRRRGGIGIGITAIGVLRDRGTAIGTPEQGLPAQILDVGETRNRVGDAAQLLADRRALRCVERAVVRLDRELGRLLQLRRDRRQRGVGLLQQRARHRQVDVVRLAVGGGAREPGEALIGDRIVGRRLELLAARDLRIDCVGLRARRRDRIRGAIVEDAGRNLHGHHWIWRIDWKFSRATWMIRLDA
jgi:hypothetical protein